MLQTTLSEAFPFVGVSLHTGQQVKMELRPAPANTGIVFHRHQNGEEFIIPLQPYAVSTTELATTISNGTYGVSTIEHVLAALNGLHIYNVEVHAFDEEVPILDGSSLPIVNSITNSKILELSAPLASTVIKKEITFEKDGKSIKAEPYDGLFVDYSISFPHPAIGEERLSLEITPDSFRTQIASARTFGFYKDVEYLHSRGLARGASLQNVVVLGDSGVMNEEGLRYPDEFVRHKILDFIGDMAMFGKPLKGKFTVSRSGHAFNNTFLRYLMEHDEFIGLD